MSKVILEKEMLKDVAQQFRVGLQVISRLVARARREPKYLSELISQEHETQATRAQVRANIQRMIDEGLVIDSVQMVKKELDDDFPSGVDQ